MKTDPRRFAPLGLVLSLLAILSLIVVLIIKGLASASLVTLPDVKVLDQALLASIGVFILGLALAAALDPERTRSFILGRQVQYGSNAFIMLAAFIGILFFINLIAYQNPMKKDVTENQQNSLAPETLNLIKALPQAVIVRGYYSSNVSKDDIQKLLDNFKQNSNGKLSYEFVDPTFDPVSAQNDGVTRDGTVVVHMGDRKETVNLATEQDLDAAILRLINPQQRVVYFLTGHGERDTENQSDTSLTQVKATLQNKNYTVKTLNLGGGAKIPADAKVVIVAGPQQPLTDAEVTALQGYLDQGGAAIVMEDPPQVTQFGDQPDPLAVMLANWGIILEHDVIIDPNSSNALLVNADPDHYGQHPISEKLRGYGSVYYSTQSLKTDTAPQGVGLTPLAQTYPEAWGETDVKSIQDKSVAFDPKTDIAGPLTLAMAAENSVTKGRLVVFGDSVFAADPLYQRGNGDILINAVDWAAEQQNLISLTPKNNVTRTYEAPNTLGLVSIILLSICLIPLLVVIAGLAAWYSRRRRG